MNSRTFTGFAHAPVDTELSRLLNYSTADTFIRAVAVETLTVKRLRISEEILEIVPAKTEKVVIRFHLLTF